MVIAAAGTGAGWRRASLMLSTDGGARWQEIGATAAPAIIGTLLTAPGAAPATLEDRADSVDVLLAHDAMALAGADDAALAIGANLVLIGDELAQFGDARQIAPRTWRLSRWWRGRRGTEAAIGAARVGDRFVVLAPGSVLAIDLPAGTIGGSVRIMAAGTGDGDSPAIAVAPVTGVSVCPPSPVGLHATASAGGSVRVRWTRRSRLGWAWSDGGDVPLGEEFERYRVRWPGGELIVEAPEAVLDGAARTGGMIDVCQLGTFGAGASATVACPTITGE